MDKKIDVRTFDFALEIINFYKFLISKQEYVLSKQLLRAGTSIGANVQEAQAAQSKKDFIAKMAIASKESRETKYWITLLLKSGYLNNDQNTQQLLQNINSIINIITKIVKTSQNK